MRKNQKKHVAGLCLGAMLAGLPVFSYAIGLGKIKINSALDEPLNAEIPFTSLSASERKKLKAALASRAEFEGAGIDRPPQLSNIRFSVARRVDGNYFLQLRTDEPFRDPFLHLLINIEWAGGRLVREYTGLIDPPYLVSSEPAGVQVPITAPAPAPKPPAPEPVATAAINEPQSEPVQPAAVPENIPEAQPAVEPAVPAASADTVVPAEQMAPVEPMTPESVATAGEAPATETEIFGPGGQEEVVYKFDPETGWPIDEKTQPQGVEPVVEPLAPIATDIPASPDIVEPSATQGMAAVSASTAGWIAPGGSYEVQRGDTMWEIAQQVRRDDKSITVEQAVMAIYQANRGAFFGDNVNNLKAGKILRIPEYDQLGTQEKAVARTEFRAQYDVWQEYKLKLASARQAITVEADAGETMAPAAVTEAEPVSPITEAAKPKVAKPVPEKKPEPVQTAKSEPEEGTAADELLKIVRANIEQEKSGKDKAVPDSETRDASKEKAALADRVATLEESLESKSAETRELGDRVGQVKEQLDNQKRLIEIENADLAKPEQKSAAKATDAAPVAPKPGATTPAKPATRRAPPPPPPAPEKGFVEEFMDNILAGENSMFVIIGLFVFLMVSILTLFFRRRRAAKIEFEESILNSTMDSEGTITGDTTGDLMGESGDTSFLSDFSQGGMGNISTDEVDPIAEAEVYLAYGRDEQAEEILREAVVKDPARHEIREKLLEIYSQRGDVAAFETMAEELYAALEGRGGELWGRVAILGRKLNPDNPMFSGGAPGSAPAPSMNDTHGFGDTQSIASTGSMDAMSEMTAGMGTSDGATQVISSQDDESLLDLVNSSDTGGDSGLDFGAGGDDVLDLDGGLDIGGDNSTFEDESILSDESVLEDSADGGIDFGMDFDSGAGESAAAPAAESGLEFDAGSSDAGLDFSIDESSGAGAAPSESGIDFGTGEEGGLSFEIEEESSSTGGSADEIQWDAEIESADAQGESSEIEFSLEDSGSSDSGLDFGLEPETGDTSSAGGLDFNAGELTAESLMSDSADVAVATEDDENSQQWDETATKLDLAKAYIDMGDAEGAKSILDEVLTEGNEDQKRQAQELSAQIT